MLNDKQIKIADFILKYLKSHGGRSIKEYYFDEMMKNGFDRFESYNVIQILANDYKLVRSEGDRHYRLLLTPNGNKAAKIGITKYLDKIDEDKLLDRAAKKASIDSVDTAKKTAKISMIISIIAIIASVIIPFLVDNNSNNPVLQSSTEQENGETGHQAEPSQFSLNRTDTLFIEQIKYSLKHDTMFLNEIKDLINKNE